MDFSSRKSCIAFNILLLYPLFFVSTFLLSRVAASLSEGDLPVELILQPCFCLMSKFCLFHNDVVNSKDRGVAKHCDPKKGWTQLMASEESQLSSGRIE